MSTEIDVRDRYSQVQPTHYFIHSALTNFLKTSERKTHQEGCGKEPKMQLNALEGLKNDVFTHISNLQYSSENLQFKFGDSIHFIQWLRI